MATDNALYSFRPTTLSTVDSPGCGKAGRLERAAGIEPASLAWKAKVLPLHNARVVFARYAEPNGSSRQDDRDCRYEGLPRVSPAPDMGGMWTLARDLATFQSLWLQGRSRAE